MKTIIFDLGGVYFTDGTKEAVAIISQKYGLSGQLVSEVFRGKLGTDYRKGIITHKQFWESAKKFWGNLDAEISVLSAIWHEGYRPITGTIRIIDELRKAPTTRVFFLSDNVQERVNYLQERYNFLGNFQDGVFSHIVKLRKPDPKFYELALEKTGANASDCIYIDDKPNLLLPAKALGMSTIHFTTPEGLREQLTAFGVNLCI